MNNVIKSGIIVAWMTGHSLLAASGTWNSPEGGDWLLAENWLEGVPNAVGDVATFGSLVPGVDATITLDGPVTITELRLANPQRIMLAGAHPLTLDAPGQGGVARIELGVGAGELEWNAPIELGADDELAIVIADGASRLIFNVPWGNSLQSLTVSGAGELSLREDSAAWNGHLTIAGAEVEIRKPIGGTIEVSGGLLALQDRLSTASVNISDGTVMLSSHVSPYTNAFAMSGGTLSGTTSRVASTTIQSTVALDGGDSVITGGNLFLTGGVSGTGHLTIMPLSDGSIRTSGLNHDGNVRFQGGVTTLTGPSAYTGHTIIESGEVVLTTASALGAATLSDADGTTVGPGGILTLHSGGPIRLDNEKLILAGGRLKFGEVGGVIELAPDTESFVQGTSIIDGTITGAGSIIFDTPGLVTPTLFLRGDNAYTGHTTLLQGTVIADAPNALGSPLAGTTVKGGTLELRYDDTEPITILGGEVEVRAAMHHQPIEMGGGLLRTRTSNNNNVTTIIAQPLTVLQGATATVSSHAGGLLRLAMGTVGDGELVFATGAVFLDGPVLHSGDTFIQSADVFFTAPNQQPQGRLVLTGTSGDAIIQHDMTADVVMRGGRVNVEPGAVLTIPREEWVIERGAVDGAIAGPTVIAKEGPGQGFLTNIGVDNEAVIEIRRGTLHFSRTEGYGSPAAGTIITSPKDAVLSLNPGWITAEPINLNNAHGFDHTGALILDSSSSAPATLTGPVSLGDTAATIAVGQGDTIVVTGAVSGGELILNSLSGSNAPGILRLESPDNDYTGRTVVGVMPNRPAVLALHEQGRLTTTSEVIVNHRGTLRFDQFSGAASSDRLADHIPVILRSGTLELTGKGFDNINVSETVGLVAFESGANTVRITPHTSEEVVLTIGELHRHAGAVAEFLPSGLGQDLPQDLRVFISQPPPLQSGILGGWATSSNTLGHGGRVDFVTYDPTVGVRLLSPSGRPSQIETASSTDNVWMDAMPAALTGDRAINSLVIDTSAVPFVDRLNPVDIDLGGHNLNIESGGLVRAGISATEIRNGTLTAGGETAGAELIVRSPSAPLLITAAIVDNPGGAVGLTIAGQGTVDLAGINTYSGPTVVNEGIIRLVSSSSLPDGTDVTIDRGSVGSESPLEQTVALGDVIVRNAGSIGGFDFTAESVTLESGSVTGIRGEAPLRKIGPAITTLNSDKPFYSGEVTIEEGGISISNGKPDWHPLGTGLTTIHAGAKLLIGEGRTTVPSPITLAGGKIVTFRTPGTRPAGISGTLQVSIDSEIHVDGVFELRGDVAGAGDLLVSAPDAPGLLHINGQNGDFTGRWLVDGVAVSLGHRSAIGSASLVLSNGSLTAAVFPIDGDLTLVDATLQSDNGSGVGRFNGTVELEGQIRALGTQTIQFAGPVSIADGATLTNDATMDWRFTDTVSLAGAVRVVAEAGPFDFAGVIRTASTDASIHKTGPGDWMLRAALEIKSGHELSIRQDDQLITLDLAAPAQAVRGNGVLVNDVIVRNGAAIEPGESTGALTFVGALTLGPGGVYEWQLQSAGGMAGLADGWDVLHATTLATSPDALSDPFIIRVRGLTPEGDDGTVADFDPYADDAWTIAMAQDASGVDLAAIDLDISNLTAHQILPPDGQFVLQLHDHTLWLRYLAAEFVLGDLDGNGVLDAFDVSPFELALSDPQAYHQTYPGLDPDRLGDLNGDGVLDAFDVGGFEVLLAGSGASAPEPSVAGGLGILALLLSAGRPKRTSDARHKRPWVQMHGAHSPSSSGSHDPC